MIPLPFEGFWRVARRLLGLPLGSAWTVVRYLVRRATSGSPRPA